LRHLVAYRWADYDTPLWANANRGSGRWHRAGSEPTQYWSLHPLGPWAEYLRFHGIRDGADLTGIASRTWAAQFAFEDHEIASVTFATAESWAVDAGDLVSDDYLACQALAEVLRTRYSAVVVPSAALPGTENLVVFGPRAIAPYGTAPVDPGLDVPAAPSADGGRPPVALAGLVRYRGEVHAGLRAWSSVGADVAPPDGPYSLA
jgi:hypothetical protein